MPCKINYQNETDRQLEYIKTLPRLPKLFLHACCAPCSSYVLEYLNRYFEITLFFYNPNISPKEEYIYRLEELKRLIKEMPLENSVTVIDGGYTPEVFFDLAKGKENEKEGGSRCFDCYSVRLSKTYEEAKKGGFDYFTTTLSISPYKNAEWLNTIGKGLEKENGPKWLFSDFKKKNGYKRSCELSAQYNLYRQNYCGCVYSKNSKSN